MTCIHPTATTVNRCPKLQRSIMPNEIESLNLITN